MTRPAQLPRWAETAGGVPSADIVEPTSGEKDAGWQGDQRPPAEYMNWLQTRAYQWFKYLDEHAFAPYPVMDGYVTSVAGWTIDSGSLRIQSSTNLAGWHVPIRIAEGHVINLADLTWRVKPNGATNLVSCGLAVYRDGSVQFALSKASTGGAVAETVVGTGATVSVGAAPYTMVAGDIAIASFVCSGGGAGAREAYWFKHTPS